MWLLPVSQPIISSIAFVMSPKPGLPFLFTAPPCPTGSVPCPPVLYKLERLLLWLDADGVVPIFFIATAGWSEDGSNSPNMGGSVCSSFSVISPPV